MSGLAKFKEKAMAHKKGKKDIKKSEKVQKPFQACTGGGFDCRNRRIPPEGSRRLRNFSKIPLPVQISPYVIIQHLAPEYKSIMSSLLQKFTKMKISEIRDGMKIEPNCIYLNPPNKEVSIINKKLYLMEMSKERGLRLPIDNFFRSLAQNQGDKSICIILSGTGSDGTLGLKAIKEVGGMAMVQLESQARYDNMPRSAIDTGLVDFVLPVEKMGDELAKYTHHPYIKGEKAEVEKGKERTFRKLPSKSNYTYPLGHRS